MHFFRCNQCSTVLSQHEFHICCSHIPGYISTGGIIVKECIPCKKIITSSELECRICHKELSKFNEVDNEKRYIYGIIGSAEKQLADDGSCLEKCTITNPPSTDLLEKMKNHIDSACEIMSGLPECREQKSLQVSVEKHTSQWQKWTVVTRVFNKLGSDDFLQKIEKVSIYLDTLDKADQNDTVVVMDGA